MMADLVSEPEPGFDAQLGGWLVSNATLKQDDLNRALKIRQENHDHEHLSAFLVKLGLVSDKSMAQALSDLLALPLANHDTYANIGLSVEMISPRFLKEYRVIPVDEDGDRIDLVMADPQDDYAARAVNMATGKSVSRLVGVPSDIEAAIDDLFGGGKSEMGQIFDDSDAVEEINEDDIEHLKDLASEAPVIRLVNMLINRAIEMGASDLHIESFENRLKISYRIDGVIHEVESPPNNLKAAVISRIKIMAKLNIAERRLPQDGRFKLRVHGKELDMRVSTIPTIYGESVVLRLLVKDSVVFGLSELGVTENNIRKINELLSLPHGMILVTGPTGSGKSTTLYTALNILNNGQRKIITVEDPVEYQVEGVNQIQVKPSIGLTFSSALRSIVRQDPDVIMVGELRDIETAKICVQSALTGHLVLSTLHTNDAAGSVTRLLEMGIDDYLLTSTLNAVVGQRLARVLCEHCKTSYTPDDTEIADLNLRRYTDNHDISLFHSVGCEKCNGSGYRGRVVIEELLIVNDRIRKLILGHADAGEIQKAAIEDNMNSMYGNGCLKALAGITTMEEILRVTQES